MNFYAVKVGKNTGIFNTWKECESNIKGYSGAKYKKFNSKSEAESYLEENLKITINDNNFNKIYEENKDIEEDIPSKNKIVSDDYNFSECINIYTDGSCINNGTENAVAGYGVYFGLNDPRNEYKKLKNNESYRPTNNRAELKAILVALSKVTDEVEAGKEVMIHTDSQYSITSFTSNTIRKRLAKDVPNYDYVSRGYNIIKKYPNIKFHHVNAHTGNQDIHSIGNENADRLANLAIIEDVGKIKFTFGKHKDKSFENVYEEDKKYFEWCVENSKNQVHDIKLFIELKNNDSDNKKLEKSTKKEKHIIKQEIDEIAELEKELFG